ncbi:homeotic protein bicoid [Eupeodes corollae]|uniref:homeotic protein bicoid n=1 Tax=Eupeodes corollae TaxID=290404 RepID=UPI00248F8C1B|nr:homeotic protein bicoid [Eupeodes corollae]
MAEEPQPCVTFLNLDSIKIPPTTMLNENRYLSLEEQYPTRRRTYGKEIKQEKLSNSLVMRRPRRSRTVFTNDQVAELKYYFMQCNYVNTERAEQLAAKLSMPPGPVRIWFKNQRRKIKIREAEKEMFNQHENSIQQLPTQYRRHTLHLPTLTAPPPPPPNPLPTPSPSISDIDIKFSYEPIYLNSSAYNVKQETPTYDIRHDTGYNVKQETAYQWLQHLPVMTPSQMVYNTASPHHIPQLHSFHDSLINFNRLPYTLPSPASTTSGDANSMTVNSDTSDYFSQMSPESEIVEPLTPNSVHGEAESVFNGILDSLKNPRTEPPIETVYEELTSAPDTKIKSEPFTQPQHSSDQSQCLQFN